MSNGEDPIDILEFIEAFRQALASPDAVQESVLSQLMAKFSSLCSEVNARLRECTALSQKGLYANAIALAERDPNLMDRCAILEIPEREMLPDVATALGMNAPPLLNYDLIQVLQETYEKGASAEGNLRTLHRLTLARAPLPTRLAIMRRLQIQDPNRPFIDADIRTFEKAWFKRAADFAQPFAKEGNVQAVEEILTDLKESGYLETPPPQLIAGLQAQLAKARSVQMPSLAAEIKQAFESRNLAKMEQLAAPWKEAASSVPDANTRFAVGDAFVWLNRSLAERAKETEIKSAQARLTKLMSIPSSKPRDVTAAYEAAQLLRATTVNLDAQYEIWMNSNRQRSRLILGAAGGGVILLLAAIGIGSLFSSGSSSERNGEAFIARLNDLMKARNYAAALDAIDQASPALAGLSEVESLRKSATERRDKAATFDVAFRKLKSATPKDDIDSLGKQAIAAASDDKERKQVEDLLAEFKQNDEPGSSQGLLDYEKRVKKLEEQTEKWVADTKEGRSTNDAASFRRQVAELREIAQTNRWKVERLDRIESQLEAPVTSNDSSTVLAKFTAEMSNAKATEDTLSKTADFLSTTLATSGQDNVIQRRARASRHDLATWQKALKLKELFATGRVDGSATKDWAGTPPGKAIESSTAALQMVRQRDFSQSSSEAFQLKSRFLAPDIKDVHMYRPELAEPFCVWYTKIPLQEGEGYIDLKVLADSRGGTITQRIREKSGKRKASVLSPQSKLLPEVERLWAESARPDQWHQLLAEAYDRVADDNDLEPLLKLQLMRKFLKLAVASSVGYRLKLEPLPEFQSITGKEGLIDGNWFDPKNGMSAERTKATSICNAAPRLSKWTSEAAQLDSKELKNAKGGVALTGLLQREGGKIGLVRFSKFEPIGDSRLYVVSEGEWILIGASDADDQLRMEPVAAQFVGWPVFSIGNANSAK